MKRRTFITSSLAAGIVGTHSYASQSMSSFDAGQQQFYELRQYSLIPGQSASTLDTFFEHSLVPALNRSGINPVGVFKAKHGFENLTRFVLIPYASFENYVATQHTLQNDGSFLSSGKEVFDAKMDDVPYLNYSSSFLKAFEYMPTIEVPGKEAYPNPVFELRVYQSQSFLAGQKKIEMFNKGGEIEIFRNTGLKPVFFGETLFGNRMPNLTYMLVFNSLDEREKNWRTFVSSEAWKTLSAKDEYKDIVSNISSYILQSGKGSQI